MAYPNIHEGFIDKTAEKPNPLHRFATYNTIFTLSGVTEEEIKSGAYLKAPLHDVVARTGGIGPDGARSGYRIGEKDRVKERVRGPAQDAVLERLDAQFDQYRDSIDVLERHHDVFFEDVNILSTVGPNSERNTSNFTKMEFKIHEPYGITFTEKVRAATFNSGFLDYQDAPLLLTIEFKGTDENGKPVLTGLAETRKIPVLIVRVDFDINEGGAVYDVTAVPYSDMPFDDRFKVLRTQFEVEAGGTFNEWKTSMEKGLDDQMDQEIEEKVRAYRDKYQFEVDLRLFDSQLFKYAFDLDSIHTGATVNQASGIQYINPQDFGLSEYSAIVKNQTQTIDAGTTVTKAFEDWIRSQPGFFDLTQDFWRAYLHMAGYKLSNDEATRTSEIRDLLTNKDREGEVADLLVRHQFIPWFKIKTTVFTDTDRLDPVTKMHPKTLVYKAIPYKIHVLKILTAGMSIGKVSWHRFVRKNYDYLYTGDNVDVQGLRLNYKSAYYMRNVRGDDQTENEKGVVPKWAVNAWNQVFGKEDYPEPLLPLRSYPSNIKGRSTVKNLRAGGNRAQEFFDYLTNPEADMMRIELDILGDPQYLCQDVFALLQQRTKDLTVQVIDQTGQDFSEEYGSFNADSFMPMINLRYRLPADLDERVEGTMFSGKRRYRDENLFFNGVYQVVKVDSKFTNGQFLQTLTCVRMNNQQGTGQAPLVLSSSAKNPDYLGKQEKTQKDRDRERIDYEYSQNERLDDRDGNVPGVG